MGGRAGRQGDRARAGRSMGGGGVEGLLGCAQMPAGKTPSPAHEPLTLSLQDLSRCPRRTCPSSQGSPGNPPVRPPCSQPSLAGSKAFPRTRIPLSDPQVVAAAAVCSPSLADSSKVPGNAHLPIV